MENGDVVDAIIERMLWEKDNIDSKPTAVAVTNMIKALGFIGNPGAAGPIISVLEEVRENEDEYSESIRNEGLDALGKIGGEEAIASIISYFAYPERQRDVQDRALAAIKRIGSPATGALVASLKSSDLYMQKNALRALGEIDAKETIVHIVPLLKKDNDVQVAGFAALAIALLLSGLLNKLPTDPSMR